jgi:hypothetical protein
LYFYRFFVEHGQACFTKKALTLIRAAGGVYDFRNREYILLSTFEQKTAFSVMYKPKRAQNRPFFCRFHVFRAAWKAYLTSKTPSTTTPGPGTPPANSQHTKQFWSRPHSL